MIVVGTTDHQARGGSNATHLVVNETTGVARCGKVVAEGWPVPADQVFAEVTCRTCLRGGIEYTDHVAHLTEAGREIVR